MTDGKFMNSAWILETKKKALSGVKALRTCGRYRTDRIYLLTNY